MEHKKQHWIPSSYLSAWCDPNTPQGQTPYVWKCSKDGKISKKKAPKNIFCESEIYTIHNSDGSRDLKWEQALNKLETCFARIKRDKFSSKLPLSEDEKILIYHFIATMRARTVVQRELEKKHWSEVQLMMNSLAEQWPNASKTKCEQVAELSNQPLQHTMAPKVRIQVTNYMSMNMAIVCTETQPGFITSDVPVVWYDPDSFTRPVPFQAPGLIYDTLQVTLPISPKQLLFISRKEDCEGYIDINKEIDIDRFNLRTWLHCNEYFIVNENTIKDFWLGKTIIANGAATTDS